MPTHGCAAPDRPPKPRRVPSWSAALLDPAVLLKSKVTILFPEQEAAALAVEPHH